MTAVLNNYCAADRDISISLSVAMPESLFISVKKTELPHCGIFFRIAVVESSLFSIVETLAKTCSISIGFVSAVCCAVKRVVKRLFEPVLSFAAPVRRIFALRL